MNRMKEVDMGGYIMNGEATSLHADTGVRHRPN